MMLIAVSSEALSSRHVDVGAAKTDGYRRLTVWWEKADIEIQG